MEIKIPGKSYFSSACRMLTAKKEWLRDGPKHLSCHERALHFLDIQRVEKCINLLFHIMLNML